MFVRAITKIKTCTDIPIIIQMQQKLCSLFNGESVKNKINALKDIKINI